MVGVHQGNLQANGSFLIKLLKKKTNGKLLEMNEQQLKEDIPAPLKLRDMFEGMAVKELLGPVGGEEEEVDERIRDRYVA